MSQITLEQGDFGTYLVVCDSGGNKLFQLDWDYPSLARTFRWDMTKLQRPGRQCQHLSTDGTVTCVGCGLTASDFITAAIEFLDANIGTIAEDPGYFT